MYFFLLIEIMLGINTRRKDSLKNQKYTKMWGMCITLKW